MIKTAVRMNVGSSAASKRSYRAQRAMSGRRRMGVTIILRKTNQKRKEKKSQLRRVSLSLLLFLPALHHPFPPSILLPSLTTTHLAITATKTVLFSPGLFTSGVCFLANSLISFLAGFLRKTLNHLLSLGGWVMERGGSMRAGTGV